MCGVFRVSQTHAVDPGSVLASQASALVSTPPNEVRVGLGRAMGDEITRARSRARPPVWRCSRALPQSRALPPDPSCHHHRRRRRRRARQPHRAALETRERRRQLSPRAEQRWRRPMLRSLQGRQRRQRARKSRGRRAVWPQSAPPRPRGRRRGTAARRPLVAWRGSRGRRSSRRAARRAGPSGRAWTARAHTEREEALLGRATAIASRKACARSQRRMECLCGPGGGGKAPAENRRRSGEMHSSARGVSLTASARACVRATSAAPERSPWHGRAPAPRAARPDAASARSAPPRPPDRGWCTGPACTRPARDRSTCVCVCVCVCV
jgi:hypothetical protein